MRVQEGLCVLDEFRYLVCQDLVSCYFCFDYCLLYMSNGECYVISLYYVCCSVNGSICVGCLTVFVNCLVKQFAIRLGVFVILLFNVMLLRVVGGALLDRPCMVFQRMCVLCLWSK